MSVQTPHELSVINERPAVSSQDRFAKSENATPHSPFQPNNPRPPQQPLPLSPSIDDDLDFPVPEVIDVYEPESVPVPPVVSFTTILPMNEPPPLIAAVEEEEAQEEPLESSPVQKKSKKMAKVKSFCAIHVCSNLAAVFFSMVMLAVTLCAGYASSALAATPKIIDGKEEDFNNYILTGYVAMVLVTALVPLVFLTTCLLFCCRRNRKKVGLKKFFVGKISYLSRKNMPIWRLLLGTFCLGVFLLVTNILYNMAFNMIPVSLNICAFYSSIVGVFVISALFLKEKVDVLRMSVIMVVVLGLISLTLGGSSGDMDKYANPVLGLAVSFTSAVAFSLYVVSYSVFFPKGTPLDKLFVVGGSGIWVVFLGIPLVLTSHFTGWQTLIGLQWSHTYLLFLAASGLVLYYSAFAMAVSVGNPAFVLIMSLLSIPLSGVLDFIVKGEIFPWPTYVGFFLILLGAFSQVVVELTHLFLFPFQLYFQFTYHGKEIGLLKKIILFNRKKKDAESAVEDFAALNESVVSSRSSSSESSSSSKVDILQQQGSAVKEEEVSFQIAPTPEPAERQPSEGWV